VRARALAVADEGASVVDDDFSAVGSGDAELSSTEDDAEDRLNALDRDGGGDLEERLTHGDGASTTGGLRDADEL